MTIERLRFAPEILQRLGEELVPHPDLGVIELVRNAYDADAPTCSVQLVQVDHVGGRIIVADDGDGMTIDDLRSGWLLLGRSRKSVDAMTPGGRRRVGEKGLGRLAALRLGNRVELRTRPRRAPELEHVLIIDWRNFDGVDAVEDVTLEIRTQNTVKSHGTDIVISELNTAFSKQDVARLARALLLLTGPFSKSVEGGFTVSLDAPEFAQLERVVHNAYFDEREYLLSAHLDQDGQASAKLVDWRGHTVATGDHQDIGLSGNTKSRSVPLAYTTPPVDFELWSYNLSARGFELRDSQRKVDDVRKWLRAVGGVHLYHRGLRVHPYGDDGHDWLDMNLRRARSPEVRPSTNTSVGRVSVNDPGNLFVPKTDRSGFVENMAFVELRFFCQNTLDWAASERLRLRESQRDESRRQARQKVVSAKEQAQKALTTLPPQTRKVVEQFTESLRTAYEERVQSLEDEVQLYRTLGTVGTTTAVFAHESARPLSRIEQAAGIMERKLHTLPQESHKQDFERQMSAVILSAASLRTFTDLPLGLVSRRKRRPAVVDIGDVVAEVVRLFTPHLSALDISVENERGGVLPPNVRTTVAAIESILANLFANAAYAFTVPTTGSRDRRIIVTRVITTTSQVILSVLDNGPGIDTARIPLEDIWIPGQTTREGGTGLGLTIVKDVVSDLDGSAYAKAQGELGGAEFRIELQRVIS
ncbi:MAG: hypothetical protein QG608_1984 [Actinomycetota bacterium]|nr:hypothetical protein [Actinomycetota bacterium]